MISLGLSLGSMLIYMNNGLLNGRIDLKFNKYMITSRTILYEYFGYIESMALISLGSLSFLITRHKIYSNSMSKISFIPGLIIILMDLGVTLKNSISGTNLTELKINLIQINIF